MDPQANRESAEEREPHTLLFYCIAVAVGVVTGIGAMLFHYLIGFFHNLLFYGRIAVHPGGEHFLEPSVWGPFIVLVPIIGGLGVVWLTRTFAPEARGSGVPEVIDAVYFREGLIRPVVALAKSLASALSIGSGASVGREGPIIQIGASLAASMALITRLSTWQRVTLIAAGAGSGIAATFNTPLGGLMFAIELMLPELSVRTFLPVVLATATATYIGRVTLGMSPVFSILSPENIATASAMDVHNIVAMSLLGVFAGLTAWAFIRLQSVTENAFERLTPNHYLRHATGMFFVGLLLLGFQHFYGHYHIAGANYATINEILHGNLLLLQLLVLLFIGKLLATTLSLGSGSSGGIFSPALFLGATLGAAYGVTLSLIWPDAAINPMEYAVIGMASIVGGVTGAAMTAIVMVFEMTRTYTIIIPLIIAVAIAIGVRRALINDTIYSVKLTQRGRHFSSERHRNLFLLRHAGDFMETSFATLPAYTRVSAAFDQMGREQDVHYVLLSDDAGLAQTIVPMQELFNAEHEHIDDVTRLSELPGYGFILVHENDILNEAVKGLTDRGLFYALIVPDDVHQPKASSVLGILDREHLADSILDQFRTFSTGR